MPVPPRSQLASECARAQTLSHARLSTYRSFFGTTDDAQALAIHDWNDELSACLFRVIRMVEVVLRNQFHAALSTRYGAVGGQGTKDWYAHVALSALSMEKIKDITHRRQGSLQVLRFPAPSPDDVVSKLSFGFWRHLLDLKKDAQLRPVDWGAILLDVLPGHRQRQITHWAKRKHQDALFARLSLCNDLRNRIAHHEPIWKFGPLLQEGRPRHGATLAQEAPAPTTPREALTRLLLLYDRMIELLGWLCPATAAHHALSDLDLRCRSLMRIEVLAAYQIGRPPGTIDIASIASVRVLRKALRQVSRRQQPVLLKDGHRTLGRLSCLSLKA